MAVRILLVCLTVLASSAREAQSVTPIEKVVDLLKKLSTQIATEGKKEAAEYDKYACFCKEQADEKLYAIETSDKKIGSLKAKEDKLKKDISALSQEISDLGTKIGSLENDVKAETDKRKGERTEYEKQAKDHSDAIDAIGRAIEALKDSKDNIDGGKVDLAQLSASSPLLTAALLAQVSEKQAPASFEYSSNDILATLEGLQATFKKSKAELDETEMMAKSASQLKVQDMSNQKTFSEKDKFEKEELSESSSEELAETTEEKTDETTARNADDEFMKVLTKECETKAGDFDQRSKTRSDEITAITKAVEDLEKNAMGFVQTTKNAPSFLQLLSHPSKTSLLAKASGSSRIAATQSVLDLLMKRAEKTNSPVLASVSMKLTVLQQSGIDHFVKVRALIKDLMTKLDKDAKSEATTKTYCDENMKKQTGIRDTAKLTIEAKDAALTKSRSELAEVKEAIAELQRGVAQNKKGLLEATELRDEQKAANELSLKVSDAGKKSVEYALNVLKEFYSKALIQETSTYTPPKAGRDGKTVGDMAPEAFSGTYHGNSDASKGIIGILEVISADFQRSTDTVEKEEKESQETYDEYVKTTDEDTDAKKKELKDKDTRKSTLTDNIVQFTDDKKDAQGNLESAKNTLDDLKKMCVDGEETYEERRKKRQEEIDALKEALEILENWKA